MARHRWRNCAATGFALPRVEKQREKQEERREKKRAKKKRLRCSNFRGGQVVPQKRPSQVVPQMRPAKASRPSGGEASPSPGFVKKPCRQQPTINITRAPHGPLNHSLIRLLVGSLHILIMLGFQFASSHASIDLSNLVLQIICTSVVDNNHNMYHTPNINNNKMKAA